MKQIKENINETLQDIRLQKKKKNWGQDPKCTEKQKQNKQDNIKLLTKRIQQSAETMHRMKEVICKLCIYLGVDIQHA